MITCDSCNQEMTLIDSQYKGAYQASIKKYKCDLCDLTKTLHADNENDEPILRQTDFCHHNIPLIDCIICNEDD